MNLWVKRVIRSVVVLVGIVVLTSFTIDATDTLNGSQSALSFLAKQVAETDCPADMVRLDMSDRSLCVDIYENSFADSCPNEQPSSAIETQQNINDGDCQTLSLKDVPPAVYVTFHQAQNFCARRGGRLPTSYEWYDAALGTPDSEACNLDGTLNQTGSFAECHSARGTFDMVGNAWEWVDAEVRDGQFENETLPPTGFVTEADRSGVAVTTGDQPSELFNNDYFWSKDGGSTVMMRGGFYRSGPDGGVYSVHSDIEPTFTSGAIGFRCVKDI